jgi:uncharacterized protein (DUF885 family)
MELLRAMRLILDTGIHMGGWSAGEAAEVARGLAFGYGEWEIDRYAAMPGQALAYKVGELEFLTLRDEAEQRLGERFDVRAFHDELLRGGPLSLDLLEEQIEAWIERSASGALSRGVPMKDNTGEGPIGGRP